MDLKYLQKKYPVFIYENFSWRIDGGDFVADFKFQMGEIEFNPGIIIRNVNKERLNLLKEAQISNLVFNIGLAEIPSYWKTACSPLILINAGYLDSAQVIFWQDLIFNMGQFFYENRLPFIKPKFKVNAVKPKKSNLISGKLEDKYLVSLGGGKDSLVTLEFLRQAGKKIETYTLNANAALKSVVAAAGTNNFFIERRIDKRLIELNKRGYLNGHTPFSSILAVLGVITSAMTGSRYSVISQERSSSEGNARYLGKVINHQYSKSLAFENKFRAYSTKYLIKKVEHFSLLRPLYEIQISKIFSHFSKYFSVFLSCNKAYTIALREKNINAGWCCKCPKCLSMFAMLYPFAGHAATVKIFGKNLFEDEELLPVMIDLLGQGRGAQFKPFECVGTTRETLAAFYLCLENSPESKPFLLDYFSQNILPKYIGMAAKSRIILDSWTERHNINPSLAKKLKEKIKD